LAFIISRETLDWGCKTSACFYQGQHVVYATYSKSIIFSQLAISWQFHARVRSSASFRTVPLLLRL